MRVKRKGEIEHFVARRYGDFHRLHHRLRLELPGKVLPVLPKKNKSDSTASSLSSFQVDGPESEDSSLSSASTQLTGVAPAKVNGITEGSSMTLSVRGKSCMQHSLQRKFR